jgi:hypothetical protein
VSQPQTTTRRPARRGGRPCDRQDPGGRAATMPSPSDRDGAHRPGRQLRNGRQRKRPAPPQRPRKGSESDVTCPARNRCLTNGQQCPNGRRSPEIALARAALRTVAPGVGDFFAEFVWERPCRGGSCGGRRGDPETRFVAPAGPAFEEEFHSSDGPYVHRRSASALVLGARVLKVTFRGAELVANSTCAARRGVLRYGSWRASKTAAGAYIE